MSMLYQPCDAFWHCPTRMQKGVCALLVFGVILALLALGYRVMMYWHWRVAYSELTQMNQRTDQALANQAAVQAQLKQSPWHCSTADISVRDPRYWHGLHLQQSRLLKAQCPKGTDCQHLRRQAHGRFTQFLQAYLKPPALALPFDRVQSLKLSVTQGNQIEVNEESQVINHWQKPLMAPPITGRQKR